MGKILAVVLLGLLVTAAGAATKSKKHIISNCRDAKSGQYVTPEYAKKFPGLTVCEQKK
jgi:hypothetical protein